MPFPKRTSLPIVLIVAVLVAIATILAFSPALFNFICGDDYYNLGQIRLEALNHRLFLQDFCGSWLQFHEPKVYRPLISASLLAEYQIWGLNGLAFRISNLVQHLICALFVFLIGCELLRASQTLEEEQNQSNLWPILAATLFALHPLHAEPVCWVTGRIDTLCSLFIFASIWCYLQWRRIAKWQWLASSLISFAFALLSKEMAVVTPVCLLALGLSLDSDNPEGTLGDGYLRSAFQKFRVAIAPTTAFWFVLAVYFMIRFAALGTFTGGYSKSGLLTDWTTVKYTWASSFKAILVPFNYNYIPDHSLLRVAWYAAEVLCLATAGLTLLSKSSSEQSRKILLFLLTWFFISLLPLYNNFWILPDMANSRYGYLASAPLSLLLAFAVVAKRELLFGRFLSPTSIILLLICSWIGLYNNCLAWAAAGKLTTSVEKSLAEFYDKTAGDPPVFLAGLPQLYNGAFAYNTPITGVLKVPSFVRNIDNCRLIHERGTADSAELRSFVGGPNKVLIWSFRTQRLTLFEKPSPDSSLCTDWNNSPIRSRIILFPTSTLALADDSGSLQIKNDHHRSKIASLIMHAPHYPCWSVQKLRLVLNIAKSKEVKWSNARFFYTNDLVQRFDSAYAIAPTVYKTGNSLVLDFPLDDQVDWLFGGTADEFKLLLPLEAPLSIQKIELVPSQSI
jgi:hypothetical protein